MSSSGDVSLDGSVRLLLLSFYGGVVDRSGNLTVSNSTNKINAHQEGYFNRHGILHGNSSYLKYGTKINALKTISLLLFVIETLDIINKKND